MGNDSPHKLIPEDPESPEFLEYCISADLESMNEPSFIEKSKNEDFHAYRFLWQRSFHQPICFRLEINTNGSAQLIVKGSWGIGVFYSEELATGKSYKLSKNAVQKFLGYLENADFWNMTPKENPKGLDGANWIIEGVKKGQYHIVDRWSPEEGAFREAALLLIKLSRLKIAEIY